MVKTSGLQSGLKVVAEAPTISWDPPATLPGQARVVCLSSPSSPFATSWLVVRLIRAQLSSTACLPLAHLETRSVIWQGGERTCTEVRLSITTNEELRDLHRVMALVQEEARLVTACPAYHQCLVRGIAPIPLDKGREMYRLFARFQERWPTTGMNTLHSSLRQFYLLSTREFRTPRTAHHLCRIIITKDLFNRYLEQEVRRQPQKRHVKLRFFPVRLSFPFGTKRAFALLVTVNIDRDHERFGQPHLLRALQSLIPDVVAVPGSYAAHHPNSSPIRCLYLEIERQGSRDFGIQELVLLRRELATECKEHVELLTNAVFVHRNEEEVSRAVLTLSNEVRYVRDLPHAILWFEGQDERALTFNVILLRVLANKARPATEVLKALSREVECTVDEVKIVGKVRRKYPKEAAVFRLRFPKQPFLRKDYSIDLYRAREFVGKSLTRLFGEIRDFNGGLILKRNEVLDAVKRRLRPHEGKQEHLLEALFFCLIPASVQSCVPVRVLLGMFRLLLRSMGESPVGRAGYRCRFSEVDRWALAMVHADDASFRSQLLTALECLSGDSQGRGSTWLHLDGTWFFGYALNLRHLRGIATLSETVSSVMEGWARTLPSRQHLRINLTPEDASLDPRIGTGRRSGSVMKMLYDGLMRIDRQGRPELSIAEHVDISEDLTTYTFYLRESYWSNGTPLTAHDFEYAWKKILEPSFDARFAYLFYAIKNGQQAKEGKVRIDDVGIVSANSRKLVVQLEHPAPYFLDLCAHWTHVPLCREVDQLSPGWAHSSGEAYVCNGPFMLSSSRSRAELRLIRNRRYWDANCVRLERIDISMIENPEVAWQRFQRDELDWIGEPFSDLPADLLGSPTAPLEAAPATALHWLKINTARHPFTSIKMRRAFGLALDRRRVVEQMGSESQKPVFTVLPSTLSLLKESPFPDGDIECARALFQSALVELGTSLSELGPIVLHHSLVAGQRAIAEEVARQWRSALGVDIRLEGVPWRGYLEHTLKGNYQIAGSTFYTFVNDPFFHLLHLKQRDQCDNATRWENSTYARLLEESEFCANLEQRKAKLRAAEQLVVDEMPIIPVCSHSYRFFKRPEVKDVHISFGHVDFKRAYIERS